MYEWSINRIRKIRKAVTFSLQCNTLTLQFEAQGAHLILHWVKIEAFDWAWEQAAKRSARG